MTEYKVPEETAKIIDEKIKDLLELCVKSRVPIFITRLDSNSEEETKYKSQVYNAVTANLELKDDYFHRFVNILNGFDTIPRSVGDDMMSIAYN